MAAVYTKPTKVPRWADVSGTIVEPSSGKKDVGWEFEDAPPFSYENWLVNLTGEWWKWINERFFDGTYGATPKESTVVQANGVDCCEFTEDGFVNLTNSMAFSGDLSLASVVNSTFWAAIGFDALVSANTSLWYDRVVNEFGFKINNRPDLGVEARRDRERRHRE